MSPKRKVEKSNSLAKRNSDKKSKTNSDEPVEEPDSDKFGDILRKKWKVFRVSPMYNFSRNKLRFYEKKLNEEINSKQKPTSDVGLKSRLTLNKNLRLNDQCGEALQVEIIKNDSQSTYVGYFISWSPSQPIVEGSVSLPILLVEGKVHEMIRVHSALCKIFDCDIQPVTFSFYALITFFVKLLETQRNNIDVTQEQIMMDYGVPGCEANDKIKVSLFLEATTVAFAVIMDSLREKYQGITTMEIILEFYNKILNHFYHVFKLDLMFAELQKITFPDAFLTSDGQLKIYTDEAALTTLEILQHFTPLDALTNI